MNDVTRECPNCRQEIVVPTHSSDSRCPRCLVAIPPANRGDAADTRTLDSSSAADSSSEAGKANQATLSWDGAAEKKGDTLTPSGSIGRFVIRRKLGEGSFGVVFQAYDPKLDRLVALKVAKLDRGDADKRTKRFVREAKAAANLRHPNIVPLYEFGQEGDQFYLASAFIAGQTLAADLDERTAQKQPIDLPRAARIVGKMAEALAYAHREGIIHRDVKPDNTMLDGKDDPLIMDFGLAARREDEKLTQEGTMMGTAAYMAPEQSRGQSEAASDQYSLGVVLYELLTGQTPFSGPADVQIFHHVNTDPVSPRKLNPDVSRDLETICLKCLEKEPSKRYADCQAFADDLRRFGEGEPVNARPVGTLERLGRWCRRKPGLASTSAAALLGVLLALGTFAAAFVAVTDSLEKETNERKNAQDLAKKNKTLADNEKLLTAKESKARADAEELAQKNKTLADNEKLLTAKEAKSREDAEERLEQAETQALRVSFENFYAKARDDPRIGVLGAIHLLPKAAKLKNRALADSLHLHLSGWCSEFRSADAFYAHQGPVVAVAFSTDGKSVLTGSWDKTARLWETATGKQIGPPLLHQDKVSAVAFSPGGKSVLTGSWDTTARLWETATGKQIGPPLLHTDAVVAVAFSPDGKSVLTGSSDKTAQVWDMATGKPSGPPLQHQNTVAKVAFSPDGKSVLTGSWDKTAQLWESATGKQIGPPLLHLDAVGAVAFSPNGKSVLTGSWDKTARLWDTATGKQIGPLLLHQDKVFAVAFSPDGQSVLTGSTDHTARLWEATTGQLIGRPLQHGHIVYAVAFSPDGKSMLTGSYDQTARLWATATGQPIGPPLQHKYPVSIVAFSPDGNSVLTGGTDKTVRLWKTATGKQIGPPLQHQGPVVAVAFSTDGKSVLTGSNDNTARLWETATGKPIGHALQHKHRVSVVAFSPNGKSVLTGSDDKTARLWEMGTGKPFGFPLQHQGAVVAVAFSPDGNRVLTGSHDHTARLWETATGKPSGPPMRHQDSVLAVAFSPDGKSVLTGSYDSTARLWGTATGKPIGPPLKHQYTVIAVAFSPDGRSVLTGSSDQTARLWETSTGKPLGPPLQHQAYVVAVAFSPDSKTLLTASDDKSAKIWDAATCKQIGPPLQHQANVVAVAFSPDSKSVLTGSHDGTARLWETASGKPLGPPLQHQAKIVAVAFCPTGKTVLTANYDQTARLWKVPQTIRGDHERLLAWAEVITGCELTDDFGTLRVLDAAAWQQRRQRLQELGGPPEDAVPIETEKTNKPADPAPPIKEDQPKEKKNKPVDPVPPINERPPETTFKGLLTDKERTQSHAVAMEAGQTYVIEMRSTSVHCYLRLFNAAGRLVAQDVNITPGILDARLVFTPREAGKYRIDAAAFQDQGRGDYTLTIRAVNGKAK